MKKATITDVAKLAGVSISTVSRVVHAHENVNSELASKVHDAALALNWHPNISAQRLRSNNIPMVGLILPNILDPFFGSLADSIISHCSAHSMNVLTLISRTGEEYDELSQFQRLFESGADGVIYCSIQRPNLEAFKSYFSNIPAVICSRHDLIPGIPHVYFNHQKGGYLATHHLIETGHKKIALIVGVFGNDFNSASDLDLYLKEPIKAGPFSGIDKYIGARHAFDEAGIDFDPNLLEFIDLGDPYNGGYKAMQRFFSKTTDIDAVFCANDLCANGAICMLNQQKILVPDDLSVIGYDNGLMATCTQPQLSTIVQDTNLLGIECVKSIERQLNHEVCGDTQIDVQLIVRQSSCRHT